MMSYSRSSWSGRVTGPEARGSVQHRRSLFLAAAISSPPNAIMAGPRPQNGSAQVVLTRERVAPITDRAVSIPLLAASFRMDRDPVTAPVQFNHVFLGANQPFQSVEGFPPMDEFKTVFFTHSSFSLLQFWSGRLQLDAFQSTLHVQSVQLGSERAARDPSLRPKHRPSLWPRHGDRTPVSSLAASVSDRRRRSGLTCIAQFESTPLTPSIDKMC